MQTCKSCGKVCNGLCQVDLRGFALGVDARKNVVIGLTKDPHPKPLEQKDVQRFANVSKAAFNNKTILVKWPKGKFVGLGPNFEPVYFENNVHSLRSASAD